MALGLLETRMFQNQKAEDCCVLETCRRQGDEGDVLGLGPCNLYEVLSVLEILKGEFGALLSSRR